MAEEWMLALAGILTILGLAFMVGMKVMDSWRYSEYLAKEYKRQRDDLLNIMKNSPVFSGVCCCGDDMDAHSNEHSPVDMWDHLVSQSEKHIKKFDQEQEQKNAA